jgi:hypothetical protein
MGRWDRFHEARRQAVDDWLADEVVKVLTADLRQWPPPIALWNDLQVRERYEDALAPECPRPPLPVFRAAFQLARWEMEREYEAIDHYVRNDRAATATANPRERICLRLLHAWLTDSCLEILEASPLKRPKLVECLLRIEARLCGPQRVDEAPAE